MGIIEQLAEMKKKEALEEGRREGVKDAKRRFVENLLKDSNFPTEKDCGLGRRVSGNG